MYSSIRHSVISNDKQYIRNVRSRELYSLKIERFTILWYCLVPYLRKILKYEK